MSRGLCKVEDRVAMEEDQVATVVANRVAVAVAVANRVAMVVANRVAVAVANQVAMAVANRVATGVANPVAGTRRARFRRPSPRPLVAMASLNKR
jgi:hypothetical protein